MSFHVGSQQRNIEAWDRALASAAAIFRDCAERGIDARRWSISAAASRPSTCKNVPTVKTYGKAIFRALRKHFGNRIPETIIEPGRGMVGNAGVIEAEVVLVSKKSREDEVRWVYLDIGKFGGLAETMDEAIRYPIRTAARRRRDGALRARRPDLRLGRRAVREDAVPAAGQSLDDRRQGADRGHRRLHGDLLVGRLQRLPAAEDLPHLISAPLNPSRSRPIGRLPFLVTDLDCVATDARAACAAAAGKELAMVTIRNERPADIVAREALLDRAFGAGALRQDRPSGCAKAACRPTACRSSRSSSGRVVGTVRLWHVSAGAGRAGAAARPARGRIRECRSRGIGAALMRRALAAARRLGHGAVLLVGDAPYYGRFGFSAETDRRAVAARAATSASGCSRSSSSPARSTARAA